MRTIIFLSNAALLASLLLIFCSQSIAATRRTSLSSTGYHDPYKFAYAVKKPLPFHSNFGQSLITDAGLPSFGNGVFGDASLSTLRDTSNKPSRSVSNSATYPLDDETLIASLDETSFGDRIVPRGTLKKTSKPQSHQQLVSNQPAKIIEKRPEPFQGINQFFANIPQVKPAKQSNGNVKPLSQINQISTLNEQSSVFPKETSQRIQTGESSSKKVQKFPSAAIGPEQESVNSDGVRDSAESIQTQFFSFPSPSENQQFNKINQELKNIESSSFVNPESPGLSYSYFVLGSSSKPEVLADKLNNQLVPSVQSELAGQVVGSPGSVTSEIDQSYSQYSPFSQQEGLKSSTNFPTAPPENTAERPFYSSQPFSKSPFSSDIGPLIQSVSSDPPVFIPSPPVFKNPQPPPVRVLEPPQPISSSPALKANFPEPNKYAGFIPPPSRGTSDTFSQFPKPNFSAFYPKPSTETVYYGGFPDEPPSKLRGSVVNFIKNNAVSNNEMKAPFEPQYPNSNTFASPSPFKTTPSSSFNSLPNDNNWQRPAAPPVPNIQPVRQQTSNGGIAGTKSNSPATQSNPSRPVTLINVKPSVSPPPAPFLSAPAPPPVIYWNNTPTSAKPLVTSNVPSNPKPITNPSPPTSPAPVRPTPTPTVFSAPKPAAIVPSPAITKPLNPPVPVQVTPVRYSQPIGQQNPPPQQLSNGNKNANPATSGGFKSPSSSEFLPFIPSQPVPTRPSVPAPPRPSVPSSPRPAPPPVRPSSAPINQRFPVKRAPPPVYPSQQIRQAYSTLTKNPAPIPVLAPIPIYLTPASLSLPQPGPRSSVYSYPEEQPVYYQAVVTYG